MGFSKEALLQRVQRELNKVLLANQEERKDKGLWLKLHMKTPTGVIGGKPKPIFWLMDAKRQVLGELPLSELILGEDAQSLLDQIPFDINPDTILADVSDRLGEVLTDGKFIAIMASTDTARLHLLQGNKILKQNIDLNQYIQ